MMKTVSQTLHRKLLTFGALRPETWELLFKRLEICQLASGEVFARQTGQVAYVVEGLLKEHAIKDRKHPAIINFIMADSFIITETYNRYHYLTASMHTILVFIQTDYLAFLNYKELIPMYRLIQHNYVAGNYLRQFFLEIIDRTERIALFKKHFYEYLPYFKKKEVANYLGIHYSYLLHLYDTV